MPMTRDQVITAIRYLGALGVLVHPLCHWLLFPLPLLFLPPRSDTLLSTPWPFPPPPCRLLFVIQTVMAVGESKRGSFWSGGPGVQQGVWTSTETVGVSHRETELGVVFPAAPPRSRCGTGLRPSPLCSCFPVGDCLPPQYGWCAAPAGGALDVCVWLLCHQTSAPLRPSSSSVCSARGPRFRTCPSNPSRPSPPPHNPPSIQGSWMTWSVTWVSCP